jgi:type VI secretion system secreted protein VgrG
MGDILHTAARNIEHYAIDDDLTQIANKGKVITQAQHNSMELTADKTMTVTSVDDGIIIQAKEYIVLQTGQSFIRITDGNITMDARIVNVQSDAPSFVPVVGARFELPKFTKASRAGKKIKTSL